LSGLTFYVAPTGLLETPYGEDYLKQTADWCEKWKLEKPVFKADVYVLAYNDNVSISMWRSGGMRPTDCRLVLVMLLTYCSLACHALTATGWQMHYVQTVLCVNNL